MKPFYFLILTFCISSGVTAQLYTSLAVDKRKEGPRKESVNLLDTLFSTSIHDPYKNDYFSVGIIYKKNSLVLDGSLAFMYNRYSVSGVKEDTHYANHGSQRRSEYNYAKADINYSYLGPKIGLSKAFFYDSKFNLLLGGFIHLDFLVNEKEKNHYDSIVKSFWFNGYNSSGEYISTYSSDYTISHETFDGLRLAKTYFSMGCNISPRYQFKKFLVSANLGMGYSFGSRTFNNLNDENQEELKGSVFTQIGLSVAYQISD